jgi:hypothetical protein
MLNGWLLRITPDISVVVYHLVLFVVFDVNVKVVGGTPILVKLTANVQTQNM